MDELEEGFYLLQKNKEDGDKQSDLLPRVCQLSKEENASGKTSTRVLFHMGSGSISHPIGFFPERSYSFIPIKITPASEPQTMDQLVNCLTLLIDAAIEFGDKVPSMRDLGMDLEFADTSSLADSLEQDANVISDDDKRILRTVLESDGKLQCGVELTECAGTTEDDRKAGQIHEEVDAAIKKIYGADTRFILIVADIKGASSTSNIKPSFAAAITKEVSLALEQSGDDGVVEKLVQH